MAKIVVHLMEMTDGDVRTIGFLHNLSRVPVAGEIVYFDRPGSPNEESVHRLVVGVLHGPTAGRPNEPAATLYVRTMVAGERFPWYRGDK